MVITKYQKVPFIFFRTFFFPIETFILKKILKYGTIIKELMRNNEKKTSVSYCRALALSLELKDTSSTGELNKNRSLPEITDFVRLIYS